MLRHVAQPLHAGGLEPDVGVEAAGYGLLDNGLTLLFQEGDEPFLGADVGLDLLVGFVQVADDGGLSSQAVEAIVVGSLGVAV